MEKNKLSYFESEEDASVPKGTIDLTPESSVKREGDFKGILAVKSGLVVLKTPTGELWFKGEREKEENAWISHIQVCVSGGREYLCSLF